ncbi:reprolysin-like metallopeptidase [Nocardioides hwasunensis]|uniref:reprolysin-like metallopeptidase n=1 Tax=Nocardioides hwasunensis TaxID=397258 RepID=UPI00296488CD|nr:M12 family metallo-peptidase [Nocardioides hwasunensis]
MGLGVLPAWTGATTSAAPDDRTFTAIRGFEATGPKVRVEPKDYSASRVDLDSLRASLPSGGGSAVVEIPGPDGTLQSFRVERTQTMESELAAAHPEIGTWAGRGVDDARDSIALDITPMGFHAFVRTPGGRSDWYVDPAYNQRGTTAHLSYRSADLPAPEKRREEGEVQALRETVVAADADRSTAPGQPVQRHFYRLALTSDPSYAAYFGTDNVLAEKVTLINRVNQIYNNDLATELRLVNGTERLNLDTEAKATGADGPCGVAPCFEPYDDNGTPGDTSDDVDGELDFCDVPTLGKNRTVLGQLIGASNYDVGHIALGVNGGGIAYLGVMGGDYKGGGCTGLPQPRGDFFAIDYVAHEIGHQFGGNHTFNGALGSCGGNISAASVEPGSGSSVMAYAGICRQDDLQPHTDPYFSFRTIEEVDATRAETYDNVEVQTVSLTDEFGTGDTLELGFGGDTVLVPFASYTTAGLETAIAGLTGLDVSVAQWGYDEFGYDDTVTAPDERGFQVIFNDEPSVSFDPDVFTPVDVPELTVEPGGVAGFVGETSRGGPAQNDGVSVSPTPDVADNAAPVVKAPGDKTIPVRTPFALTATGSDPDGDALVYLWEQTNFGGNLVERPGRPPIGQTRLADNTKTYGPLFRVFGDDAVVSSEDTLTSPSPGQNIADGNPTRIFPDMTQVLAGNTNAATGTCPTPTTPQTEKLPAGLLDCYSEFLPTADYLGSFGLTDRAMNFRVTGRDLFPNGGGVAHDDVTLTVDPSAGPFLVTSQATAGATVPGGASVPVTWAVNGTQRLASTVRISLSTDGGATFGTVLATATPNDGSETVTLPNITAGDVRIKIEAVDNYFFDVNDASFKLAASPAPGTSIKAGPAKGAVVLKKRQTFSFTSTVSPAVFQCTLDGKAIDCATGSVTVKVKPGTHEFSVAAVNAAGIADATPATRTFTLPRKSTALKRSGGWQRVKNKRAYGNRFLTSRGKGAALSMKVKKARRVGLVVATSPKAGRVHVFIGKKRIKTVQLKGKNRFSVIKVVKLGKKARTGKLRIVAADRKPVRIEGVAVITD